MPTSTQQHIDIAGIKDGIIILKNGGYRLILSTSTVNFALKSDEEQNSLIFQYQGFLNSLHFPIEIIMQSRRLDLTGYLNKVNKIKDQTKNELLQLQMEDYIQYVNELINVANIMKKSFYVVVSHQPVTVGGSASFLDKLLKKPATVSELRIPEQEFNRHRNDLIEKANVVASGLGAMGIHCQQLGTEEIIELFYKMYNPEIAGKERIDNVAELTSPYIEHVKEQVAEASPGSEQEAAVIDNSGILEAKQKEDMQRNAYEQTRSQGAQAQSVAPAPAPQQSAPAPQQSVDQPGPGTVPPVE